MRAALFPLALQIKLLNHKIATDDFELDAPPDVSKDVVMLRNTLDTATSAFFRCEAGSDTSAASLQSKLAIFLHADRSKRDETHSTEDGIYGANLAVHIQPAAGVPNSLFVVLTFDIKCGDDNLLFLYTRDSGQWVQRLNWYSDKYAKPSDAFGDFFVYTVVPGPDNNPLIAVAHGQPWCTSRFSGFRLDLLQPAAEGVHSQRILASTQDSYSRGDTTPTLKPNSEGVTLRLDSSSRDLEGVFTYIGIFRYQTSNGSLERLAVAGNARDFVDSWLDEDWAVAARWSANPNSSLRDAHRRFTYEKDKDVPRISYGPVRECASNSRHFQVELDLTEGARLEKSSKLYAEVRENTNSFTMLSFTGRPDPTCTGPDLVKKPSKPTHR